MRYVRERGYPVPAVYAVSGPDMVMERVDGPTMLKDLGQAAVDALAARPDAGEAPPAAAPDPGAGLGPDLRLAPGVRDGRRGAGARADCRRAPAPRRPPLIRSCTWTCIPTT